MLVFIDTEYNDHRGELISMGLVTMDNREWYEVLPCTNPSPWVAEHVMPVLKKEPLSSLSELSKSLELWFKTLPRFESIEIIADWPADIEHFCNVLITEPGKRINTPNLYFRVIRDLGRTSEESLIPHNALEDAKSLRKSYIKRKSNIKKYLNLF